MAIPSILPSSETRTAQPRQRARVGAGAETEQRQVRQGRFEEPDARALGDLDRTPRRNRRRLAGETVDVSLVDDVPTVLDVCGLPPADHGEILAFGRSLAAGNPIPPDAVFAENDRPVNGVELMRAKFPAFDVTTIDHPMRTIVTGRHKLIWHVPDRTELYDLVEAARGEDTLPLMPLRWDRAPMPDEALSFITGIRTIATGGDVFTQDVIDTWIGYKRAREVDEVTSV